MVLRPIRPITDCRELPISAASPRLGESVLVMGFPDLELDVTTLSAFPGHVVNAEFRDSSGLVDYLVFAFVTAGSSGGPILNTDGEVVGLVRGHWTVGKDDDGNWIWLNYLVTVIDVAKHLR